MDTDNDMYRRIHSAVMAIEIWSAMTDDYILDELLKELRATQ